jgi:hypothetical protein
MPESGWVNVHWKLKHDPVYMEGYIWSDENRNDIMDDYEDWSNPVVFGCSTAELRHDFGLRYTGFAANQINNWYCHGDFPNRTYYSTQSNIETASAHQFELFNLPSLCYEPESWYYVRGLPDGSTLVDTGFVGAEPFRTDPDLFIWETDLWRNVNWKMNTKTYNLIITVSEIKPELTTIHQDGVTEPNCNTADIYRGPLGGAYVQVFPVDTATFGDTVLCEGTTNATTGEIICPIPATITNLRVVASKDTTGDPAPERYSIQCPGIGAGLGFEFEIDGGVPDVDPLDDESLQIGLLAEYKDGWTSAIDSDIFAGDLSMAIPAGPTNNSSIDQIPYGFAKSLINSSSDNDRFLGFTFYESDRDSNPLLSGCTENKMYENDATCNEHYGAFAYNLLADTNDHKSKWLESFSFTPIGSYSEVGTLDGLTFVENQVYKINAGGFNSGDIDSYNIDTGSGVSILYVEGDIEINNNINTTDDDGRLLMIVKGSVTVGSSVGTSIPLPPEDLMSNDPDIEVGIIAEGEIIFDSVGGDITDLNQDIPIMVSAPLISKTGITLSRDLYHYNNAVIPAQSAKAFNKFIYYLTALERGESGDALHYTGLTNTHLDWEYIY